MATNVNGDIGNSHEDPLTIAYPDPRAGSDCQLVCHDAARWYKHRCQRTSQTGGKSRNGGVIFLPAQPRGARKKKPYLILGSAVQRLMAQ